MNLRALKIYGIGEGRQQRSIPMWALVYLIPGLVFAGFGAFSSFQAQRVDTGDAFALVMGVVLIVLGAWGHVRQKRFERDTT